MTKSQIEEDLRSRAISLYVGPFNYYCGYISDSKGEVFADLGSILEQEARIRGWGRIQKLEDAEALQDKVGELFAEALSQFWLAAKQDEESQSTDEFKAVGWLMWDRDDPNGKENEFFVYGEENPVKSEREQIGYGGDHRGHVWESEKVYIKINGPKVGDIVETTTGLFQVMKHPDSVDDAGITSDGLVRSYCAYCGTESYEHLPNCKGARG